MPKVSIIIPTYNRASFLKSTIESILAQNFTDYEIIITDNNSTDHTKEVVESFKLNKIFYFKNTTNVGLCENYNIALKFANGEYIQIFSDDDIMLPNCLSKKVKVLNDLPNIGLVHSNINIINENGIVVSKSHWALNHYSKWAATHFKSLKFTGEEYFKILYFHWNIISMPSVMIRKSCIDKIGFFSKNIKIAIDFDYWLRLTPYYDFYYVNEKLIEYRFHSSNNISEYSNEDRRSELIQMKENLINQSPQFLKKMKIKVSNINYISKRQLEKYHFMNTKIVIYENENLISFFKHISI